MNGRQFGESVDVGLLSKLKVVEAERDAVIARQRVAQFVDREVAAEVVFHWIGGEEPVYRRAVIIGSCGEVKLDNPLPLDFAGPHHHGDVVVRSDVAALWIQAEASAEFSFYAEANPFRLGNGEDSLAQVLSG